MNLTYEDLTTEEKELLDSAEKALFYCYNPYNSHFKVGASVRAFSKEIISGSNIANASSTVNLCAERVAFAAANSKGIREIESLAIIGIDEDGVVENPVMPCGVCRQFMEEFMTTSGKDITIICSNSSKDKIIKTTLSELLPYPYGGSFV